jgi:hypothetical protein
MTCYERVSEFLFILPGLLGETPLYFTDASEKVWKLNSYWQPFSDQEENQSQDGTNTHEW